MQPWSRYRAIILLVVVVAAATGHAITNGVPDDGEHPYVGQLLFYVPDAIDPRFTDPGAWFSCSGTLMSSTIVLTAGHCANGIGFYGSPTSPVGGDGGTDIWVNFDETPDLDGFPSSAAYELDANALRYTDREDFLDAHQDWTRGAAYAHPDFNTASFVFHDVGVVMLSSPVMMMTYGRLPTIGYLDQYFATRRNSQRFTPVGYGLTQVLPMLALGGDSREKASVMLVSLAGC